MYITASCHIRNNVIITDSGFIFQEPDVSLDEFLLNGYKQLRIDYPKFYKMDNLSKLGFLAAEALLVNRVLKNEFQPNSIALVLSNAHASLDTDTQYLESTKTMASPSLFVYTLPNIVAGEICIRHGIKGENAFFITEKFDAILMEEYVSIVMAQPGTKICMAGWIDVWDGRHDVFLYLVEKFKEGTSPPHTQEQLTKLYSMLYGTIDGKFESANN